jgi:hypothetical protein
MRLAVYARLMMADAGRGCAQPFENRSARLALPAFNVNYCCNPPDGFEVKSSFFLVQKALPLLPAVVNHS